MFRPWPRVGQRVGAQHMLASEFWIPPPHLLLPRLLHLKKWQFHSPSSSVTNLSHPGLMSHNPQPSENLISSILQTLRTGHFSTACTTACCLVSSLLLFSSCCHSVHFKIRVLSVLPSAQNPPVDFHLAHIHKWTQTKRGQNEQS